MTTNRFVFWCVFATMLVAHAVRGQSVIAAGSAVGAAGRTDSCSWLLVRVDSLSRDPQSTDDAQVLLIPSAGVDGLERIPGVVRLVRILDNWPDSAAARDNQLTMAIVSEPYESEGMVVPPAPTEVVSLFGNFEEGRWRTSPEGSFDQSPSLPAHRAVYALAYATAGLVSVVEGPAADSGIAGARLMLLSAGRWDDLPRPDDWSDTGETGPAKFVYLAPTAKGVALVCVGGAAFDELRIWHGELTAGKRAQVVDVDDDSLPRPGVPASPGTAVWRRVPAPKCPVANAKSFAVSSSNGQVVLGWGGAQGAVLVAGVLPELENAQQWRTLATIPNSRNEIALAPLDSEKRLIVFSKDGGMQRKHPQSGVPAMPSPQLLDAPLTGLRFAEVSAATGRVLAEGDVALSGPATRSDYRAVGLLLAWVIGLVLIIVVRPRDDRSLLVPEGLSFSEPAQRMIAGTVDLVLCLVGAGFALGKSPMEVLTSSATGLVTSTTGQLLLLFTVLLGIITGTLGEWTTGRTIGKALCGCVVADLTCPVPGGKAFARGGFGWVLLRNVIKWCLPPAGLVGLMSPGARHRGDEFAGLGVLSPTPADDGEEDGDQ